jgi:UrcA family protein
MKTLTNNKVALLAVATLGVALYAGGAHANDAGMDAQMVRVGYADLNLGTDAGAKALYQRIHAAAVRVCGDADTRQLDMAAAAQACRDRAIVNSVRAVNNEWLTRTANAHGFEVETNINVAAR